MPIAQCYGYEVEYALTSASAPGFTTATWLSVEGEL